ncbi:MAG: lysophospholipid acyltransferase family protein [Proteobacteria bacterium]|nr:lysophospholipid acyltransferase family protein [Pseudomonadota bacterium]
MTRLIRFLSLLPLPLLHNLGALLGWLAYVCSPTYRRHLNENAAFAGVSGRGRRLAVAAEAGKGILELPKIWLRPLNETVARVVRVSGWELVEKAWHGDNSKHGILFLTPHLGCFEITAQYYASRRPITVLYRPPKLAWVRPLVEGRRSANLNLAAADLGGVRTLMKALKRGEAIGMLPDQVPGKGEGVWAPFFGHPAYSMSLAARLAESGATVLLAYAERLAYGAGYHLKLRPLTAPLSGTLDERVGQINRELEKLILECPEQYLWGYNRYKVPAGAMPPDCLS